MGQVSTFHIREGIKKQPHEKHPAPIAINSTTPDPMRLHKGL